MSLSESKIDAFYSSRGAEFGFLERLELRQSVDPKQWTGVCLDVDLRSAATATSRQLRLAFVGVKDLQIGALEGLVRYMIEIRSLGDSQLEGRNYRISESEYDAFSFVCDDFTMSIG
jgi:hypothetical protein